MNVWLPKLVSVLHSKVRGVPLWVIGSCGLAGILIDIDHPISYWITGKATRADHIPVAVISCISLCVVSACIGGLYCRLVLRGKKGTITKFVKAQVISWSIIIGISILVYLLLNMPIIIDSNKF
jgi:hypothetical protein